MPTRRKPPIPVSGVVYGEIIYWGTCISALLVIVGTIRSFLETGSLVSVSYLLDAALSGKNVETIWAASEIQRVPNISFYISTWTNGESLTVMVLLRAY